MWKRNFDVEVWLASKPAVIEEDSHEKLRRWGPEENALRCIHSSPWHVKLRLARGGHDDTDLLEFLYPSQRVCSWAGRRPSS